MRWTFLLLLARQERVFSLLLEVLKHSYTFADKELEYWATIQDYLKEAP